MDRPSLETRLPRNKQTNKTINTNRGGGGGGGSLHSLHPPYPPLPTAASIMRARENTITASFLSSAARRCVNHTCTLVGIYFLDLGKRTMDGKGSSPTVQHTPSCPWRSIFFAHSKKRGNRPGSLRLSLSSSPFQPSCGSSSTLCLRHCSCTAMRTGKKGPRKCFSGSFHLPPPETLGKFVLSSFSG